MITLWYLARSMPAGNGVALAALERAQAAEVDELLPRKVARGADLRLRHQIDMELGAGADLEVLAQEYAVRAHRRAALAPVDGIARVGVDERALRRERRWRGRSSVSCSAAGGGGKMKGNKKKPSATPNAGAEHGAGEEDGKRAEHERFRQRRSLPESHGRQLNIERSLPECERAGPLAPPRGPRLATRAAPKPRLLLTDARCRSVVNERSLMVMRHGPSQARCASAHRGPDALAHPDGGRRAVRRPRLRGDLHPRHRPRRRRHGRRHLRAFSVQGPPAGGGVGGRYRPHRAGASTRRSPISTTPGSGWRRPCARTSRCCCRTPRSRA